MIQSRVSAALEAIYEAAPNPSLWPAALQSIAHCFDDVGAVLAWQREDGAFDAIASPSLEAPQRDFAENGWNRRDLAGMRVIEKGLWLRADAITDLDVVSQEELATHPFYTEFMMRHGLSRRCSIGLAPKPDMRIGLTIQRAIGRPNYSAAEMELATRLGRHAERALRLTIGLLEAEIVSHGLSEALARCGIGAFVLDRSGCVLMSNPAAEAMVGSVFQLRQGRLRLAAPENRDCEMALDQILTGRPAPTLPDMGPIVLKRTESKHLLATYLLPLQASAHEGSLSLARARAIMLLVDAKAGSAPDPAVVRDLLGLTLGEARLAALIGTGLSPRAVSEKLGIAEETARTVLKRVFHKTGVSRQSELAALLSRLTLR